MKKDIFACIYFIFIMLVGFIGCVEENMTEYDIVVKIQGENLVFEHLGGKPLDFNEIEIIVNFSESFIDINYSKLQNLTYITVNYSKFLVANDDGDEYWEETELVYIHNKNIGIFTVDGVMIVNKVTNEVISIVK